MQQASLFQGTTLHNNGAVSITGFNSRLSMVIRLIRNLFAGILY
jgi:hypothetical protein